MKGYLKQIRIVKKGQDESNLNYWISRSYQERLEELERIREEVINQFYETTPRFQRVYRVIKRGRYAVNFHGYPRKEKKT